MKNYLSIALFLLLLNVGIVYLFYTGIIWFNNPSRNDYPVQGIDISHHQGTIDWNALKSEKIDFIYMKATEGGDYIDSKFKMNWKNAKREGYAIGTYHFYRLCTDWKLQAHNIIETIPKEDSVLPIVIDLEYIGNCKTSKRNEDIQIDIRSMVDTLENYYGKKPIFYVTKEFFEKYLMGNFDDISLWYRDIFMSPKIKGNRNWLFWQYSNRGHIQGIKGYVDQNVFHGSKKAFNRLLNSK